MPRLIKGNPFGATIDSSEITDATVANTDLASAAKARRLNGMSGDSTTGTRYASVSGRNVTTAAAVDSIYDLPGFAGTITKLRAMIEVNQPAGQTVTVGLMKNGAIIAESVVTFTNAEAAYSSLEATFTEALTSSDRLAIRIVGSGTSNPRCCWMVEIEPS